MSFVLEPQVLLEWYFSSDEDPALEALLDRFTTEKAKVPTTWWTRLSDQLIAAERTHRIDASDTAGILSDLAVLPIETVETLENGQNSATLALARKHLLTAEEASYLALADQEEAPLATRSRALAQAARAEGISLLLEPLDPLWNQGPSPSRLAG